MSRHAVRLSRGFQTSHFDPCTNPLRGRAPTQHVVWDCSPPIAHGTILRQAIKQVSVFNTEEKGRTTETRRKQVLALRAVFGHTSARSTRILASLCLNRPPFFLRVKNTCLLSCWLDCRPAAKASRKMDPACCPAR